MIESLPLSWDDKQNSPELEAYFAQLGKKYYFSAEEINQLRDGMNQVYGEFLANTDFIDSIDLTSAAPVLPGIYIPTVAGTYANYGGLVVDLDNKISRIIWNGSEFRQQVVAVDMSNYLKQWVAQPYPEGAIATKEGKDWIANTATLLTDVPGVSSKWDPRLDFYKKEEINNIISDAAYGSDFQQSKFALKNVVINSFSNGVLNASRTNGKTYPWVTIDTDKLEFTYRSEMSIVIGKTENSVVSIYTANNNMLRFLDNNSYEAVFETIPALGLTNGQNILMERVGTVLTLKANGVLKYTFDFTSSTIPEMANPVFGFNILEDNYIVTGLKTKYLKSKFEAIDEQISEAIALNDAIVVEGNLLLGMMTLKDVVVNSLIGSALNTSRLNSKNYPWWYIDGDKFEFQYNSSEQQSIVIGKTDTSVVSIYIANNNMLRFLDNNSYEAVSETIPALGLTNGQTILMERVGTILTLKANGVLKYTFDFTSSTIPEMANPVFGLNVLSDNSTNYITNLRAKVDKYEYLENLIGADSIVTDIFEGLNYTSLGDSLGVYNAYQPVLISKFGIASHQNLCISGTTICNSGTDSIINRVALITGSPKLITIEGGTNDFGTNKTLGTISSTDNTNFYGALKSLASTLKTNHPTAIIVFITPTVRNYTAGGGQEPGMINANGNTLIQFVEAMKEVCKINMIPCVNMLDKWKVSYFNLAENTLDGLHPNPVGFLKYSKIIIDKINQDTLY